MAIGWGSTFLVAQEAEQLPDTVKVVPFVLEASITPSASFSTYTLDSTVIQEKQGATLADILQQNSSISIRSYGQGGLATASIRGTGASHAKVYWNGIELNQPSLGQIDFSLIPVSFTDEIELHLGNSSMVDGFGGLGGSIQMTNKAAYHTPLRLQVHSSYGSFSDTRNFVKVSHGNSRWSVKTALLYNDAKNDFPFENIALPEAPEQHQQHAAFQQSAITQEIYFKIRPQKELSLKSFYTSTKREIPGLMTSTVPSEQQQDDRMVLSSLQYSQMGGKYWFDVRSGWVYSEMDYLDEESGIDSRNFNAALKNQARFKYYAGDNWILKSSVFADFDQAKTAGYDDSESLTKLGWLIGVEGQLTSRIHVEAFVRPQWVNDTLVPWIPSLGVQYQPFARHAFTINATWARNFHFPSLNDIFWRPGGNPDLQPESGWNTEFSIRKSNDQPTSKYAYRAEITGFYGEIDDWILWSPSGKGYWEASNLRAVEHQGVEVSLEGSLPIGKWKTGLQSSYSFVESTHTHSDIEGDASVGNQLIFVPYHKLQYEWFVSRANYRFTLGYRYVGKRFTTTDNSTYLPEYDLMDIRLNKRITLNNHHSFFIQVEVNNLLDKSYMSLPWRAMPGRNARLTLRYTLAR